jgi:hypothetical protein
MKVSFDLHVLGTPPAFVLSQDQTLRRDLHRNFPHHSQVASSEPVSIGEPVRAGRTTPTGADTRPPYVPENLPAGDQSANFMN